MKKSKYISTAVKRPSCELLRRQSLFIFPRVGLRYFLLVAGGELASRRIAARKMKGYKFIRCPVSCRRIRVPPFFPGVLEVLRTRRAGSLSAPRKHASFGGFACAQVARPSPPPPRASFEKGNY